MVNASFQRWPDVCDEVEIETLRQKYLLCRFAFIIRAEHFEDPAVLTEPVIGIPDDIMRVGIEPVVKTIAAEIAAKFLVKSARDGLSAFLAIFHLFPVGQALRGAAVCIDLHGMQYKKLRMHSSKGRYIRLQTVANTFIRL